MIAPRPTPDRAALEIMHGKLRIPTPLDDMLKVPALKLIIESVARRHMRQRAQFDPKKAQANDL